MNIKANKNAIGVGEMRILEELRGFNRMLTEEEFYRLMEVYYKALKRVEEEAREQGIDVSQN